MSDLRSSLNRCAHIFAGAVTVPLTVMIHFPPPVTASWGILLWFAFMGGFAGYGIYQWAWR